MSRMTPETWKRVRAVFEAALERPAAERDAFIRRACTGEPDLAAQAASLLAGHTEGMTFLDQPVAHASEPPPVGEVEGRVGAYRLTAGLGRGGMGEVFLAERDDASFRKRVAVKLLRADLAREDLVRRFESERQILADLEHPAICRLIDGGTTEEGRPYLVMEHVEGEPIDTFCQERGLPPAARLELFARVCRAVHVAHQHLVVHRDLKPSNILVTADGDPKLLDFGIAKLLEASIDAAVASTSGAAAPAGVTQPGGRPMTPAFASPEQLAGGRVSTASDVYSLGVVLCLLLTGQLPPEPTGDPHGSPSPADREPSRSAAVRGLTGDIDAIIGKALARSPADRYASAEKLADDIDRHLAKRPVSARAATWPYRARTFVRRHRAAVAAAAVAGTVLTASVVALWIQRGQILRHLARAEAVSAFLVELFTLPDPGRSRGERVAARELLDQGASRIEESFRHQPRILGDLGDTIGRTYMGLGLYREAEDLLGDALSRRTALFGERHPLVAASLHHLAEVQTLAGRYAEAEMSAARAVALRRDRGMAPAALAESLIRHGRALELLSRHAEADARFEESLALARELGDPELAARALDRWAISRSKRGEHAAAARMLVDALETLEQHHGGDHPRVADALNALGLALRHRDLERAIALVQRAETIQRTVFAEPHPHLVVTLNNLGMLLRQAGRSEAADAAFDEAMALGAARYRDGHPRLAQLLGNVGLLRHDQERLDEAEALHRRAIAMLEREVGRDHPETAVALGNLARTLEAGGRTAAAEELLTEAHAIARRHLGEAHRDVATMENNLGRMAQSLGDVAEALAHYRQSITTLRRALGPDHPQVAMALYNLASLEQSTGELEPAEASYRAALGILVAELAVDHLSTAFVRTGLASLLRERGAHDEAVATARAALSVIEARLPPVSPWRAAALGVVGPSLADLGRHGEAVPFLDALVELRTETAGPDAEATRRARERLAAARAEVARQARAEVALQTGTEAER